MNKIEKNYTIINEKYIWLEIIINKIMNKTINNKIMIKIWYYLNNQYNYMIMKFKQKIYKLYLKKEQFQKK